MQNNDVHIFISKKETDWESARRIKKYLEQVGGDRLKIFISQDILAGEDWRKSIESQLAKSDGLILLFGEPTNDWDWCLYEVGLFTSIRSERSTKSICLYSPKTKLPTQLDHMQHVSATNEKMEKFIIDFLGSSKITGVEPPLNKRFTTDKEAVKDLASKLCNEINASGIRQTLFYNAIISINIDPDDIKDGVIPKDAWIVDIPPMTLEVFGFLDKPAGVTHWTWGLLEESMTESQGDNWSKELSKSLKLSCEGKALQPIINTIKSLSSGKVYRPNINRRDLEPDGTVTIHILFIQEPIKGQGMTQLTSSKNNS